jgi:hypothetical protein
MPRHKPSMFPKDSHLIFACKCCRPAHGKGTLYITTQNVRWISPEAGEQFRGGLTLHWRSILIHAVSRDPSSFPHPCMYCQVRLGTTFQLPAAKFFWFDVHPAEICMSYSTFRPCCLVVKASTHEFFLVNRAILNKRVARLGGEDQVSYIHTCTVAVMKKEKQYVGCNAQP